MATSPTTQIDCCHVNTFGETCGTSVPENYDVFGGANVIQTCTLVLSNLFLVHATYKAFYMRLYDIGIITLVALLWSAFYHLCKSQAGGGNLCLLPFCMLKHLDYASSTTALIRVVLHVFLPVPLKLIKNNKFTIIRLWNKFVRGQEKIFIASIYIFILILLQSTIFCSGTRNGGLFALMLGLTFGLILFELFMLFIWLQFTDTTIKEIYSDAGYNWPNLILGLFFGVVAIVLFFIEDATNVAAYWYLHSLWHVFAALSQTILLDVRTPRRGILLFVFCEQCSGVVE